MGPELRHHRPQQPLVQTSLHSQRQLRPNVSLHLKNQTATFKKALKSAFSCFANGRSILLALKWVDSLNASRLSDTL